jgi:hypothetical protein
LIVRLPGKTQRLVLTVQLVPDGEEPVQRRIDPLSNWK